MLPQVNPVTSQTLNYAPVATGAVFLYAVVTWLLSARKCACAPFFRVQFLSFSGVFCIRVYWAYPADSGYVLLEAALLWILTVVTHDSAEELGIDTHGPDEFEGAERKGVEDK